MGQRPNDNMSNGKTCRKDKTSNGTKRRIEIMLKVRQADWDKMLNGKKCCKKCRTGHHVKWDKTLKDNTSNGTKHRIGHIVEYRLCFIVSTVDNFRVFKKTI